MHHRNTDREINGVWPILSELQAPLGVYSVLGNHDHWAGADRSFFIGWNGLDRICGMKPAPSSGEGKRLWIAGGGDLWSDHRSFDHILLNVPRKISGSSADTAFSDRVDLIISGHTHGGQVYIPFYGTPPFMPVRNMNYNFGLKTSQKGGSLFISKGVGWGAFPVRFNCPPQIVLELVNSTAKPQKVSDMRT